MKENIISINEKDINLDNLSDEKILNLYEKLKQREIAIYEKMKKIEGSYLSEQNV